MFDQLMLSEPAPEDGSAAWWFLAPVGSTVDFDGFCSFATAMERIEDRGPCAETLTVLAAVEAEDVAAMSDFDRVTYLRVLAAHVAWLESRTLAAVASVATAAVTAAETASSDPLGLLAGDEVDADEVGAALRLAPGTAARKVACAQALAGRLRVTRAALEAGQISAAHAAAATEATADLSAGDCARVEARVFPRATTQTLVEFKRSLRRAVASVCPGGFAVKHAAAAAKRCASMYDLPDGMAAIHLELRAADAQLVWRTLDVHARADGGGKDAGLSLEARRADALVDLVTGARCNPAAPRRRDKAVTVGVVIDLATLLGLQDHPAELTGHGPIPADVARTLARDAAWTRFITDPITGGLLDYGRTRYTPTQALSDLVLARHPRCVFPGCSIPARHSDLDHAQAWSSGGHTNPGNLRPLSEHHHTIKTHHGWAYVVNADHSVTWTSPAGHTYHVPLDPLLE